MNSHEDLQAKTVTYARGQIFLREFRERMGANSCEGILGVTLDSPEYEQQFQELRATRCVDAVRTAAQIIDGLL